jgi:predicted dehydrogenase
MATNRDYALAAKSATARIPAPELPYRPRDPKRYRPAIALIGCGGITSYHLRAYKRAGYDVVALCNPTESKARARQKEFYPKAAVYTDYHDVLNRDDIEVVDIATHPAERVQIITDALNAGKHVLSQKPFVTDLDIGLRLCDLADRKNRKLAVNQNGRWAPHFSWIHHAIRRGVIGQPFAAHLAVHWDHNWIKGTPFERIPSLILSDFGVHWFDILCAFMGDPKPTRVFASRAVSPSQKAIPPLLSQVLIEYEAAQATLVFDADVRHGKSDDTYVAGPRGTLRSTGPSLEKQKVTLSTPRGVASPALKGSWFRDGFHGTMAELLRAVEERREPSNNARDNLASLALCFAACASAQRGEPMIPGTVRRLPS